ncbi:MAG: FAD-dependent oxidoreductase [Actinomycetota bacterium]
MPSVIVVGGGVAGLVIARDLAIGGMSVTILEASDHLGGKVARHTVAGIDLDAGAESFAVRGGSVAVLAAELGLEVVAPRPEPAWLKPVTGEPIRLPATSLLGIPGDPMARDVIGVIGLPAAERAMLDAELPASAGSDERTLGGLVSTRMGDAVLERLVAPIVTGIHSRHPDDLEVDVVAPGLRAALAREGSLAAAVRTLRAAAPAGSAVAGIRGGMFELANALAAEIGRLGVEVRLGSRVTDADALDAGQVVLATPLDSPTATTITLATLVVDVPALDVAPRGTGLLVAAGADGVSAKALTHSTAKWAWLAAGVPAHRHVIRLSYATPPDDVRAAAISDAETLLGVTLAEIIGFDLVAWPAVPPVASGVLIGESVSGTGLAAVVSGARKEAERLLRGVDS